jgi:hypothetical protein
VVRTICWVKGLWFAATLAMMLGGCGGPDDWSSQSVPDEGPLVEAYLFLSEDGPARPDAVFDLPDVARRATKLTLRSLENHPMSARVSCDRSARLLVDGTNIYIRPDGRNPSKSHPAVDRPPG